MEHIIHNLKPIYNEKSKILILGSMPSTISRIENFYYANKKNRFWPIMETLFNISLTTQTQKEDFLLQKNIALWDVIKECDIDNSKDSSIKNVIPNNIQKLVDNSQITIIFTTGKISYNLYNKYLKDQLNIPAIYLPSPSSANANYSLDLLIKEYKIKALITKDSGEEGGMKEKIDSALINNVKIIVIKRLEVNYGRKFNNIEEMINFIFLNNI